ncbi:hypothetical protein EMCG_07658 [[Emmonsia] crescens]|uniref:SGNH hydrolase-type esterase domain-containing protein n=1 Tax=[Emmonsia] crescens TaxID=73230 RepID=A0A0G2J593_9EURO|nr:hypothetical protein EMCG_07658 [Emmonsia crescens UAMH 3008]
MLKAKVNRRAFAEANGYVRGAHEGFPIDSIGKIGKPNCAERPNVVLLLAGTYDVVFNVNLKDAPNTLSHIIDDFLLVCPDAVVLVGTLIPLLDENHEARRISFNAALTGGVIEQRIRMGKHVLLVDMGRVTREFIDPADGIHPVDEGYKLIAEAWYEAIVAAGRKGWIGPYS